MFLRSLLICVGAPTAEVGYKRARELVYVDISSVQGLTVCRGSPGENTVH